MSQTQYNSESGHPTSLTHWDDEYFVSEMEDRYNYFKNGGRMISAEEANKHIKEILAGRDNLNGRVA